MQFFRELWQNAQATYSLQKKYYWITTAVGFFAIALGILIAFVGSRIFASLLGIPLGQPVRQQPLGPLWVGIFLAMIPFVFYLAGVVVASIFGLFMVRLDKFTPEEAKYYALRSRYPARWYKK